MILHLRKLIENNFKKRIMKMLKIRIILTIILITILNANCAPHCDDEDYARDKKEAALYQKDSLHVSIVD